MSKDIPQIINNFNVYKKGTRLIGVSGEVSLPEMEQMSEAVSMAGMLGESETPAIGHFSSMEQELPFTVLDDNIFDCMTPMDGVNLTFRGSEQFKDPSTGAMKSKAVRVVEKGTFKKFAPGNLKKGGTGEPTVTYTVDYILIEVGGKKKLEFDRYNGVYKINGKDILKNINKQC